MSPCLAMLVLVYVAPAPPWPCPGKRPPADPHLLRRDSSATLCQFLVHKPLLAGRLAGGTRAATHESMTGALPGYLQGE